MDFYRETKMHSRFLSKRVMGGEPLKLTRAFPLLSSLDVERADGVHQGCPAIHRDDLAGNPACFF
jgi:hypothetical protein